MSIKERCLMMERAIYAEEELQEVLVEYQDMWDYMEEVYELERKTLLVKREGKSSQGDGGWPSTARCSL